VKHFIISVVLFCTTTYSQPISLRDTTNQYDYIIITVPQLVQTCEQFKTHKETIRNFTVLITDTQQIFQEFYSYGTKQENIRDFISYAGTFWQTPQPKYFLLAGDLSKVPNDKFPSIPGYPLTDTTRTDYYYSQNLYDVDSLRIDFYVGRVAARDTIELNNYFQKVINYESDTAIYQWNNNVLLLAQSEYPDGNYWEQLAFELSQQLPTSIIKKFIFESDTSEYYGNTDSILSYVNSNGTSMIFFSGHSNYQQFTFDSLFDINDVGSIQNGNKYFITMGLYAQYFSDSTVGSISDKLVLSPFGSIGGFSAVGKAYSFTSNFIYQRFSKYLYSNYRLSLGEVFDSTFYSLTWFGNETIRLYNVFGDPSLKLKYNIISGTGNPPLEIPTEYSLEQNYPNPFNPTTKIEFAIPTSGVVTIVLFDILGKEVATVTKNFYSAGKHTATVNLSHLSSGLYFYTMQSGKFIARKKMVLIK